MNIDELLGRFRSEDIAHALRGLGLAASGTKGQRLGRLLAETRGTAASELLALFRAEDLQRICVQLGVDSGPHGQMVGALARQVATTEQETTDGGGSAPAGATEPEVSRLSRLKRVGMVAAIAALAYRLFRAIRRRR